MIIKNLLNPGSPQTFGGVQIDGDESYSIAASELKGFQLDEKLSNALTSDPPTASIDDVTGSDGLEILLDSSNEPTITAPFASKTVDGKKIFRRKHGITQDCPVGNTTFEFVVPYDLVKINELEVVNGQAGDTVDLVVHDTPQGHIQMSMGVPPGSITPSAPLNQFGFDVALPDGFFHDESQYDADLIKDMKIVVTYKNNGSETFKNGMNIVYHELK